MFLELVQAQELAQVQELVVLLVLQEVLLQSWNKELVGYHLVVVRQQEALVIEYMVMGHTELQQKVTTMQVEQQVEQQIDSQLEVLVLVLALVFVVVVVLHRENKMLDCYIR